MPYGTPWPEQDYVVYRCVECDLEFDYGYTAFCPFCGKEQPERRRMDAAGYSRLVRRAHEINDVQSALDQFRGFAARLWMYSVSHAELQIVFYRAENERMLLLCGGTEQMNLATKAWRPNLVVEELSTPSDDGSYLKSELLVRDRSCEHFVRCRLAVAYIGYDSSFCGDGLC